MADPRPSAQLILTENQRKVADAINTLALALQKTDLPESLRYVLMVGDVDTGEVALTHDLVEHVSAHALVMSILDKLDELVKGEITSHTMAEIKGAPTGVKLEDLRPESKLKPH